MVTSFHASVAPLNDYPRAIAVAQLGGVGVDVFFALSGLLITKLLLEEHDRNNGRIDLAAFYIRRCFRVWAPCYVYLAVLGVVAAASRDELVASLLFVRNYMPAQYGGRISYTTHLWSLAVETHFYLLWPFVFAVSRKKQAQLAASWLAVACALWSVVSIGYGVPKILALASAQFRTDYRLDALLWGCVIAFLLHGSAEKLRERITPGVFGGAAAAVLLCLCYFSPVTRAWLPQAASGIARFWMPMLMPVLITATVTHPEWWFSRLLEWRPMAWIGKISFSLYLWQMIFLVDGVSASWWQRFPGNLALTVLVAAASYYLMETRLQRMGHAAVAALRARRVREGCNVLQPLPGN